MKDHTLIQHYLGADPGGEVEDTSVVGVWTIVDLSTGEALTTCDRCGFLLRKGMWATCTREGGEREHGAFTNVKFREFDFELDGEVHRVDSIEKLRKIERESMERFRAGQAGDPRFRGARPVVFRNYSRNWGNRTDDIELVPNPERLPPQVLERMRRAGKL